jgi:hypothetical protein
MQAAASAIVPVCRETPTCVASWKSLELCITVGRGTLERRRYIHTVFSNTSSLRSRVVSAWAFPDRRGNDTASVLGSRLRMAEKTNGFADSKHFSKSAGTALLQKPHV